MIDAYEEIFDDEFNAVFAQRALDNQVTEEAKINGGPGPLPPQVLEQQPLQEQIVEEPEVLEQLRDAEIEEEEKKVVDLKQAPDEQE